MQRIKEEVEEMKKLVDKAQHEEQGIVLELLGDMKKTNKRMFVIWIITFVCFLGLLGYTIWLLNDIGVIETEVIQENADGYNNYIGNDGDITNG